MKRLVTGFLLFSVASFASDPSIAYFMQARSLTISAPGRQNYFIIDADVWKYARADLADLRLYDGSSLVPHALTTSGGVSSQEIAAKILNLGSTGGHTEFDLEISGADEYDRLRLQLDARNFINNARVDFAGSFGGYKQSGNGREWGQAGFEEFLELKSVFGYAPSPK